MQFRRISILLLFLGNLLFLSCQRPPVSQSASATDRIQTMLDSTAAFKNSLTGLVLYDVAKQQPLFEQHPDKGFVPASNTKLYTLFASLRTLGDSIPALRYVERNDSLIFWGTGDPTFLHPKFDTQRAWKFLKNHQAKTLIFSAGNWQQTPLGKGWMWDDYNDDYQPEMSAFPMYGNIVNFSVTDSVPQVSPAIFQQSFYLSSQNLSGVQRTLHDNIFQTPLKVIQSANYQQIIPYKTSAELTQQLLSDTLKRDINLASIALPKTAKTLYSMPVDTVYRLMMQVSDNLLAEQLLLLAGQTLTDTLSTEISIREINRRHLKSLLPDSYNWVDGSGVSRYNLFTPRSTVKLLTDLYAAVPTERLFSLLASSGQAGTMRSMFKGIPPFVFAKSGSMTGVYNLSGYLRTKQGKLLAFSFLNNNFTAPISQVRRGVERMLLQLHEQF